MAKALTDRSCFDQVFFTNSGAEANEGAIKLARKYGALHKGGAYEIIAFDGGFHGRTLATMSASGKKAFEPLFEPKVSGFPKAQLNDLASVESLITDKTIAVMLEPIQGEAGVWPATDKFLHDLRDLTKAHGLLLITDEIQTGMGRTGKLFHYEHADIEPDIMTLGKGIGGGVPLAALLATQAASCFEHGDQGGTFNGNPLMCAAGLAVLEQVSTPEFLKSVTETGLYLESELQRMSARHGSWARSARLPWPALSPEGTQEREGFLHPYRIEGGVARVELRILLRDFATAKLEEKARILEKLAGQIEAEHPGAKIEVKITPQYRNMADGLAKEPRAIPFAEEAMRRAGLQPRRTIVRGGTDGSRLTELGLPTPNLSTGEHNLHSPLELTCLEEMATAVNVVVELAKIWGEQPI